MILRNDLIAYLKELFAEVDFPDYSYNGLQYEGKEKINKIVAGVDATREFFAKASEAGGDFALVHHGLFWKGAEWTKLDRINKRIFKSLLDSNINLYALHLPIDAHPVYGNNAQIAKVLDAKVIDGFGGRNPIGVLAHFDNPLSIDQVKEKVEKNIGPVLTHLNFGKKSIESVAIVSGGGWSYVTNKQVYDGKVDLILTGEVIHQGVAACREHEIHMISAGHYATEVFGVQATAKHLAEKFSLEYEFIDLPTGL